MLCWGVGLLGPLSGMIKTYAWYREIYHMSVWKAQMVSVSVRSVRLPLHDLILLVYFISISLCNIHLIHFRACAIEWFSQYASQRNSILPVCLMHVCLCVPWPYDMSVARLFRVAACVNGTGAVELSSGSNRDPLHLPTAAANLLCHTVTAL